MRIVLLSPVLVLLSSVALAEDRCGDDVAGRTWDVLSDEGRQDAVCGIPLSGSEVSSLAGRQVPLCMIGDSITWAEEGDFWRLWLLREIPNLAFVGTHTARLGFSHAGEGGDSTVKVLSRLTDGARIPDCPYYHLMIGINDCSAAKTREDVGSVASNTVFRIWRIVDGLLARPKTKKVFLASVLPGDFPGTCRDEAGAAANAILRHQMADRNDEGRIVWVEYEKPLRERLSEWKNPASLRGAHPTAHGYEIIANIGAEAMKKSLPQHACGRIGALHGVLIENLWNESTGCTCALIPGWYVLSFDAKQAGVLDVRLYTEAAREKFDRTYKVRATAGGRCELAFMTGYEGYGYTESPFRLMVLDSSGAVAAVSRIQIEKMRPSRKASRYGCGTFVDSSSPICAGEWIVR